MKDEGNQQLRLVSQSKQCVQDMLTQFSNVAWSEVAQLTVLGPRPETSSSGLVFGACTGKSSATQELSKNNLNFLS